MKNLILIQLLFISISLSAQDGQQYFEGTNNFGIDIQKDSNSIWQVGPPKKPIFNSASSLPNAIVTDTINSYPVNDTSSFIATINANWTGYIWAFQWTQKLDFQDGFDWGKVEFKMLSDTVWENAFTSPYVYNYYGYDSVNIDTMPDGELAFTGTDTTWKDIWFCLDGSFIDQPVMLRFTSVSDSSWDDLDGWMIDNMISHITMIHTVGEEPQEEYMKVFPTQTSDMVYIETKKVEGFHIIETIELYDLNGNLVQKWGKAPTKFRLNLAAVAAGNYILRVKTNLAADEFKIQKL